MLTDEEFDVLVSMGLTTHLAKVYLITLRLGCASVKTIAKASRISRPNLYSTLTKLQELGIIEKIVGVPTKFKAIPLQQCLQTLMRSKTEEYYNTKLKIQGIMERLKEHNRTNTLTEEGDSSFILFHLSENAKRRIYQAWNGAEENVKSIIPPLFFEKWDAADFRIVEKANKRGVRWQLLIEEKDYDEKLLKLIKKRHLTVELRLMSTSFLSCFSVFDNKELFYSTSPEKDLRLTPHLWTNNAGLIAIVNDYFDRTWLNSKQVSVEEEK